MASQIDLPRVAIVGGGVIGMSTAVRISQSLPGVRVTVIAEKFTPNTTGDVAAGYLIPYLLGDDKTGRQMLWFQETFEMIRKLYLSNVAHRIGISLISGYILSSSPEPVADPIWKDTVMGFHHMSAEERQLFGGKHGVSFTTFATECPLFLPFLAEQFKNSGGQIEQRKVERLQELAEDFDVVVNCTGVFAKFLTEDELIHPLRGQILRVKAPWIKTFVMDDSNYILPNQNLVVLGGTRQKDDWNLQVDSADREFILNGCYQLIPNLRNAKVIGEFVGLRPGRNSVRLEKEELQIGQKKLQVVHNYGHGGSGITLSWGCAGEAVNLVAQILGLRVDYSARLLHL